MQAKSTLRRPSAGMNSVDHLFIQPNFKGYIRAIYSAIANIMLAKKKYPWTVYVYLSDSGVYYKRSAQSNSYTKELLSLGSRSPPLRCLQDQGYQVKVEFYYFENNQLGSADTS